MKLSSILGQGRGKLGAAVFSSTNGQQVVRQYQPNVKNPNTVAQTMQRARFKLMTQIASSMAPVIAIPKSGAVSSRNMFVKKNMPLVIGTEDGAQLVYENLQLTSGTRALPGIYVEREAGKLKIGLLQAPTGNISRVAYCAFAKDSEGQLSYEWSIVSSTPGAQGTFDVETNDIVSLDVVFYAYGMVDTNAKATAAFENYHVDSATDLAKLIATRKLSLNDFSLTKTRGTTLKAGENQNVVVPAGSYGLYVNATAHGYVTVFINNEESDHVRNESSLADAQTAGTAVKLVATADQGYRFVEWRDQNSGSVLGSNATYQFSLNKKVDVLAVFDSISAGGGEDPLG